MTDVWPSRAAHSALRVRLLKVLPAARPRTQKCKAHTWPPARRSINTAGSRRATGGPTHTHAHARHARTHTQICTHARKRTNARTHTRTRASTNAQRAQTHDRESRARARIRTARVRSCAHGRYRRGGSARTSAAASRLPTDRMRARMHLRYRAQSGDAVAHRCPQQQAWRHCPSHLAICPPIYAPTHAHTYMCIHRWTNTSTHTHTVCAAVCVRAGGMR